MVWQKYDVKVFTTLNAEIGSVTKFNNIDFLALIKWKQNFSQNKTSGLESLASELFVRCNLKHLIMKIGSQGFIAYQDDCEGKLSNNIFLRYLQIL